MVNEYLSKEKSSKFRQRVIVHVHDLVDTVPSRRESEFQHHWEQLIEYNYRGWRRRGGKSNAAARAHFFVGKIRVTEDPITVKEAVEIVKNTIDLSRQFYWFEAQSDEVRRLTLLFHKSIGELNHAIEVGVIWQQPTQDEVDRWSVAEFDSDRQKREYAEALNKLLAKSAKSRKNARQTQTTTNEEEGETYYPTEENYNDEPAPEHQTGSEFTVPVSWITARREHNMQRLQKTAVIVLILVAVAVIAYNFRVDIMEWYFRLYFRH